ncbi:MAG: hypothetical protein HC887_04895 [Desulfobacteraceae bacterium]|nr:hypothetical protein [Desulfobacteraceae bacterium]
MRIYVGLIALGIVAVGLSAYLPILIYGKTNSVISFLITVVSFIFPLLITFIVTQRWMEDKFEKMPESSGKKMKTASDGLKKNMIPPHLKKRSGMVHEP